MLVIRPARSSRSGWLVCMTETMQRDPSWRARAPKSLTPLAGFFGLQDAVWRSVQVGSGPCSLVVYLPRQTRLPRLPTSSNNVYSMRAGAGMPILGQQKGSGAQAARYDPELQLVLASREGQRWAPRVEGAVHWHHCLPRLLYYCHDFAALAFR